MAAKVQSYQNPMLLVSAVACAPNQLPGCDTASKTCCSDLRGCSAVWPVQQCSQWQQISGALTAIALDIVEVHRYLPSRLPQQCPWALQTKDY